MYFDVDSLLPWVREQLKNGCSYEQLVWALSIEQGYAWHIAHRIVEACVQYGGNGGRLFSQAPVSAKPSPAPLFTQPGQYEFEDRPLTLSWVSAYPQVAFFDGLLTNEECDALIDFAKSRRSRSQVAVSAESEEMLEVRNSSTAYLPDSGLLLCAEVRQRVSRLMQWPEASCERLQVQHYEVGQQYRPHHDYFDEAVPGHSQLIGDQGNRVATVILYLNQPKRGGGTYLASLGFEVFPRKGGALFFAYPELDATSMSLHAGSPVLEGEKWIATLWFRQGGAERTPVATP